MWNRVVVSQGREALKGLIEWSEIWVSAQNLFVHKIYKQFYMPKNKTKQKKASKQWLTMKEISQEATKVQLNIVRGL